MKNRNFVLPKIAILLFILTGCKKNENPGTPEVTTLDATKITTYSATVGGNLVSDGGDSITEKGIYWGTSTNPEVTGKKLVIPLDSSGFSAELEKLSINTVYYIKAYAVNALGEGTGAEISFKTNDGSILFNTNLSYGTVTDVEGNTYKTIQIGTQTWMAENLRTTHFNDGTTIPMVADSVAWGALTTPAYCWYKNDESSYKEHYGALYNWYAVNTGKLAPKGWHVASDSDWTVLTDYLGGERSGGKLKETSLMHWHSPNTNATNESGFSAIPGGLRNFDGTFKLYGYDGHWWSSTEASKNYAYRRELYYQTDGIYRYNPYKKDGCAVRCVKDN